MTPTPPKKNTRRANIVLVMVFFALLWLPLVDNLLGLDHTRPTDENRALAPPPVKRPIKRAIKEFPRNFEAWYNDRFGFRTMLVRQYHTIKTGWLGIANPDLALVGKEGWLFLGRKPLIDEARGLYPALDIGIDAWASRLEEIRQWQVARGGKFLLVLVPDKHRIYPEYLPDWFVPSEQRRKEQFLAAHTESAMDILDLTQSLRDAKAVAPERLWLKTDTHWSGVGAYYGYAAILEHLGMTPLAPDAVHLVDEAPRYEGDWHNDSNLAGFLGVRGLMPESWVGLLPNAPRADVTTDYPPPTGEVGDVVVPFATKIDDDALPTALLIGDSFRWGLVPLMSENFRQILYTDFRYCFFDPTLAEELAPDVIIFLMTERMFLRIPMPPENNTW